MSRKRRLRPSIADDGRPRRPPDRLIVSVDDRRPALLDVIRQARRRITLSLFRANDAAVFEELKAAVARGVAVEVLVTTRAKGTKKKTAKLWRALEETGASLYAYSDPVVKYHAKYLVADDGPAIVASLNFTKKCFRNTCDALVITHDPAVVDSLRRLWTADCDGQEMPADLTERLIIGPERARRQFTALLEGARASIRLIDAKLSDPDLVSLLNDKRTRRHDGRRLLGQATRRAEIARQDHAARRPDGRRRQPGAGGAQPRLPPRGRDRRHPTGGGRRGGAVRDRPRRAGGRSSSADATGEVLC